MGLRIMLVYVLLIAISSMAIGSLKGTVGNAKIARHNRIERALK